MIKSSNNKKIFILWLQGFDLAPRIVKKCVRSWEILNPDWQIIRLDNKNLSEYIDINDIVPGYKDKKITEASLSDMIRLLLLKKYGGLWVDATMYCNQPLSTWFSEWENAEFCALPKNRKKTKHMIATFFLYSKKESYAINRWCEETQIFWKDIQQTDSYSWVHLRFNDAFDKDEKFRNYYENVNCKKFKWYVPNWNHENGIGFLWAHEIMAQVTENIFNIGKQSVACKLTHKLDDLEINDNSIYNYL